MFNLLISSDTKSWDSNIYEFDKSRVAREYTVDEISERYKFLDETTINELKSFPTLFVVEQEEKHSRIGYITDIKIRSKTIKINFEIDTELPKLPKGTIDKLRTELDLGKWELSRTHWAIKDENIFDILIKNKYLTEAQVIASKQKRNPISEDSTGNKDMNKSQVFIVHGHDEIVKLDISKFITELGLEPIILHEQASSGRTIIEKIEAYSNVGFAIVLYTPCDVGAKKGDLNYLSRARQNVVFEHGYLIAKLGRAKVTAIVKGEVETPNDISGVVYINLNQSESWKAELRTEIRSAGYTVKT